MIATNVRAKQVIVHSRRKKSPVLRRTKLSRAFTWQRKPAHAKEPTLPHPSRFWFQPATFPSKRGSYHLNEVRRNINLDLDGIPASLLAKVVLEHVTAELLR
jgi:hypothetical protein